MKLIMPVNLQNKLPHRDGSDPTTSGRNEGIIKEDNKKPWNIKGGLQIKVLN